MVKISVYNKGRLSKIDSLPLLYVLSLMQFLSAMVEEFLALLTRDNSTASSRSLMSSKPVTSLVLALFKLICSGSNEFLKLAFKTSQMCFVVGNMFI